MAEETLPAPLVPANVDLTDFEFMPLEVQRLRDSSLSVKASGDEFRAAVLLWCAAWHQRPAASLPDDDGDLANLAGYGRVEREWLKVKKGALRGWVKCSDGRLYHPVVAEKAMEGWASKQKHAWGRECDRLRKENKKRKEEAPPLEPLPLPTLEAWIASGHSAGNSPVSAGTPKLSEGKPPDRPPPSAGNPAENPLKGQGQGEKKEDLQQPASVPPARAPTDSDTAAAEIVAAFDRAQRAVWGSDARHQPRGKDTTTAHHWHRRGLDPGDAEALFREVFAGLQDRGKQVPQSLVFVDAEVTAWLAERRERANSPERVFGKHVAWYPKLAAWFERGQWVASNWGPKPGEQGCQVPLGAFEAWKAWAARNGLKAA